ncbi:hypothetical protein Y699_02835 [Aspergillus fumigatus Z5]|nr:hypothetical protein Y699_02835 [Aspergillus fumigatus Z5]
MHGDFDNILVSVNSIHGITHFGDGNWGFDGNQLDESVLANMKGTGEPIWEHDCPREQM